jgi:hypothetical protein
VDFIATLALAMGSAWVSGINLYATVATLGLLGRFAGLQLPGELSVLTSWWVIGVAAALYCIEFVADKVPLIDSTWDLVHTFIRVPAGAALAATAFGDFDRGVQVIAFLLGGTVAFSSHSAKAATRAAINTSPEPVSNIAMSLTEDVVAIGGTLLSIFVPILMLVIVAAFLVIAIIMLPKMIRLLRRMLARIRGQTT